MAAISYGFNKPGDLFDKLKRDGARLTPTPSPDDVFNFLVTAAALHEWVQKTSKGVKFVDEIGTALRARDWQLLPPEVISWIADKACVPHSHPDMRYHVANALNICWDAAGASKHFYWTGPIKDVQPEPIVEDEYQYIFTSAEPDLYVNYDGEVYGMSQVRGIVFQYYDGPFRSYSDAPRADASLKKHHPSD